MTPPLGGPGSLPRPIAAVGVPVAGVVLTALFVFLGFPYERLRDALAAQFGRATGTRVSITELGPSLSLLGPGVAAEGLVTTLPDRTQLRIDRARLRLAWSTAWLFGVPAVFVDVEAPLGRARGTVYAGDEPRFVGRLRELDLGRLPIRSFVPNAGLEGVGESEVDLRRTPTSAAGHLRIRGRDGSLAVPGLSLALPFAELVGDLRLGDSPVVEIEHLELDGPMFALRVTGSVQKSPRIEEAPVRLDAHLEVREEGLRSALASVGIRLGPDGSADVRIVGTVGSLVVR